MIHVDEFISCDEDGNEVAELLAVISLTCCNPARKYNNCLAQKKKNTKNELSQRNSVWAFSSV